MPNLVEFHSPFGLQGLEHVVDAFQNLISKSIEKIGFRC